MLNIMGLLNFNAPLLPFVLLSFPILLNGRVPYGDLIGIFAGALYLQSLKIFPWLEQAP